MNGYKTDLYFYTVTLLLNLYSFWIHRNGSTVTLKRFINLTVATFQIFGLIAFFWMDTLHVDKVYEPVNNEYNLYSSITGWYKRAYFKAHEPELGGDGELWETKVPYLFPFVEIETSRDRCHKIGTDSNHVWQYRHVSE